MREKIAEAFYILETIAVKGPDVDAMYRVRTLLAEVNNAMAAAEAKSAPSSVGACGPATFPPEGGRLSEDACEAHAEPCGGDTVVTAS